MHRSIFVRPCIAGPFKLTIPKSARVMGDVLKTTDVAVISITRVRCVHSMFFGNNKLYIKKIKLSFLFLSFAFSFLSFMSTTMLLQ